MRRHDYRVGVLAWCRARLRLHGVVWWCMVVIGGKRACCKRTNFRGEVLCGSVIEKWVGNRLRCSPPPRPYRKRPLWHCMGIVRPKRRHLTSTCLLSVWIDHDFFASTSPVSLEDLPHALLITYTMASLRRPGRCEGDSGSVWWEIGRWWGCDGRWWDGDGRRWGDWGTVPMFCVCGEDKSSPERVLNQSWASLQRVFSESPRQPLVRGQKKNKGIMGVNREFSPPSHTQDK